MKLSPAEINYLSAIQRLSKDGERVSTSLLANEIGIAAASVTDMVQRLAEKEYVRYEKYKGVSLLPIGEQVAEGAAQTDDLWRQFMQEVLKMKPEEVPEAMEEFRKIQSPVIRQRLQRFLEEEPERIAFSHKQSNQPADLFTESVSNAGRRKSSEDNTSIALPGKNTLADLQTGDKALLLGVNGVESDLPSILQVYQLPVGSVIEVKEKFAFDGSMKVAVNNECSIIANSVAEKLRIEPVV